MSLHRPLGKGIKSDTQDILFIDSTYNCTDEHQHLLMDVHTKLRELMASFESQLPRERGLLLRPELRRKMKLSRQKKLALARSSQLKPTLKRGRKKGHPLHRNRVGKKAQNLRKVLCHIAKLFNAMMIIIFLGSSRIAEED